MKIEKDYAMETLKKWADQNLVMIRNRSWVDNSYFPDDKNTLGTLVSVINGKHDFYKMVRKTLYPLGSEM